MGIAGTLLVVACMVVGYAIVSGIEYLYNRMK
jgi:hypothetical protein